MVAWVAVVLPVLAVAVVILFFFLLYFSTPSKRFFDLKKKHALVTGGSKGIGFAIATSLINRGCNVSIFARKEADLKEAAKKLQELADSLRQDQKVRWYSLDMTSEYSKVEEVIRASERELGPVDVLINNAGHSVQDVFEKIPIEDFSKQVQVNYLSAVYATRSVIEGMKSRKSGHISFVSSAAGQCAIFGYSAYSPTKFALRGFADVLHMELLPYKVGVSVLYPPNTDTEGFKEEILTMPEELIIISDSAGLVTPEVVAEAHVKDIVNGEYTTTIGFEGWMLGVLTAGAAPEKNVLRSVVQSLFAGVLRFVMLIYIGYFNRIVKKCAHKRMNKQKGT